MRALSRASLPLLGLGIYFLPALPAAAEVSQSQVVLVRPDDVIEEDFYAAANSVSIEGKVDGDLMAIAFDSVTISGEVSGDVMVVAPRVTIGGSIGGSVRVVANRLEVKAEADVGDDLLAAAWTAALSGEVGRDVVMAALEATVAGTIDRNLLGRFGALTISASVEGDVDVSAAELTVGADAHLRGDLSYRSDADASIDPDAAIMGSVRHRDPLPANVRIRALRLLAFVITALVLVAVGLAVVWARPRRFRRAADALSASPFRAWLSGLLFLMGPIVVLVAGGLGVGRLRASVALPLLIVLVPLIIAALGVLVVAVTFSFIPVAVALGRVILRRRSVPAQYLLGTLALGLLLLIPILGTAVAIASAPLGLGAWWMAGHPPVDRTPELFDGPPQAATAPDH
jgi:cytoskeletal protein CcmA (bactofilin family)